MFVVVDHRTRPNGNGDYRIVPLSEKFKREGAALWLESFLLKATGKRSMTGSVKTYRANLVLDDLAGRGCRCHCCHHYAMPVKGLSRLGELIDDD